MAVWFELKKYISAYPRLLFTLLSMALTCALLLAGVNVLLERERLFEPFTAGVVDLDGSGETRLVFDFFSEAIDMEYMEKAEAEAKLKTGAIPAYVELPERFAADIMNGANTPFKIYGNSEFPLQLALSKLLAAGGIAFLSSSQAGIYATLDYAREHGFTWEQTDRYILYPVNVTFARRLLEYGDFFDAKKLPMTAGADVAAHYALTFTAFVFMLTALSFAPALRGYTPAVYARYRQAGRRMPALQAVRFFALFIINAAYMVPLYALAARLTGAAELNAAALTGLSLAACVSAFGMLAAALFKNDAAFGLFIFVTALLMLFCAGGILPLTFLPAALHPLRRAALPYWASEPGGAVVLAYFTAAFFGVVCVVEFLRSRFSRAV